MKIFSGHGNIKLAEDICNCLEVPLGSLTIDSFPDGETDVKLNEDVRGRDIFLFVVYTSQVIADIATVTYLIDCRYAPYLDPVTVSGFEHLEPLFDGVRVTLVGLGGHD